MNRMINKRRSFIKQLTAFSTAAALAPASLAAMPVRENKDGEGYRFLFQGDSITDGNRTRNNDWNHVMGHGYQYIIAGRLWYEFPAKGFHFFNRGISGNKIPDLLARWQPDALDLKPDLLSILIGINDVAASMEGKQDFSVENYKNGYVSLLDKTREALPNIQLVLCEPFILPVGKVKDRWTDYSTRVQQRQSVVKELAVKYNAIHVPFQSAFDKSLIRAPAEYWIWDGIHPMPAGHELMAREWLRQVSKILKFIKK
jgi:lysophospholipase L1-like esterase